MIAGSARTAVLGAILPTDEQTWVLRACLQRGEQCRDAWRVLEGLTDNTKAAMADDRWSVKRLLPALYVALRQSDAVVDPALLPYLRLAYVREQMRATTYRRVCCDVLALLAEAGIPVVLLRGAALAATVYGDPALRHCHDIALLLQQGDVARAADALRRNGLTPQKPGFAGPAALLRHETSLPVELHTRVFSVPLYSLPWSELWPRTDEVKIAGTPTNVLAPADALLHVCGHMAYSSSRDSLRWVGDAWHLIRVNQNLDWDSLCATAERARLTIPLAVALRYLSEALSAPIPERALQRLHASAMRAPPVERDVALSGARSGAYAELGMFLRRVSGGWRMRALAILWLLGPSREYVRDVVGVRGRAQLLLHYLKRPASYVRRLLPTRPRALEV